MSNIDKSSEIVSNDKTNGLDNLNIVSRRTALETLVDGNADIRPYERIILESLRDVNPEIRECAARMLASRLKDIPQAIDPLFNLVSDPISSVRYWSIRAMTQSFLPLPLKINVLSIAIMDSDSRIREEAIVEFSTLLSTDSISEIQSQLAIEWGCNSSESNKIECSLLDDIANCFHKLESIGTKFSNASSHSLKWRILFAMLLQLEQSVHKSIIVISEKSSDHDISIMANKTTASQVRSAMAEACTNLSNINEESRYQSLRMILDMFQLLPASKDEAMLRLIDDPSQRIRRISYMVLGAMKTPDIEVISQMIDRLSDMQVKSNARLLAHSITNLISLLPINTASLIPKIDILLHHPDSQIQSFGLISLGSLGQLASGAIPKICRLLEDLEERNQITALSTIIRMGSAAASTIPFILPLITNSEKHVRVLAAQALGSCLTPNPFAIQSLLTAIKDKDELVQLCAAESLALLHEITDDLIHSVTELAKSPDPTVQIRSAALLQSILKSSENTELS